MLFSCNYEQILRIRNVSSQQRQQGAAAAAAAAVSENEGNFSSFVFICNLCRGETIKVP